jgi:hypothetical protein
MFIHNQLSYVPYSSYTMHILCTRYTGLFEMIHPISNCYKMVIINCILSNYVPINRGYTQVLECHLLFVLQSLFLSDKLFCANMSTEQQKAFCALRFSKRESLITVQHDFCRHYGIDAPTTWSIRR